MFSTRLANRTRIQRTTRSSVRTAMRKQSYTKSYQQFGQEEGLQANSAKLSKGRTSSGRTFSLESLIPQSSFSLNGNNNGLYCFVVKLIFSRNITLIMTMMLSGMMALLDDGG